MEIDIRQYAKIHGKTPAAIKAAIKHNRLTARKIAGVWLVDRDEPYPADGRRKKKEAHQ